MNKRQAQAEAYLGRYLRDRSDHPDIDGLTRVQRSMWTTANLYVHEEASLTRVEVDFGRNRVQYVYAPVYCDDKTFLATVPDIVEEEPWRYAVLMSATIYDTRASARCDLIEALPGGWNVFVDFGAPAGDSTDITGRYVTVAPSFGNKFHFITLAHEVGHVRDCIRNPKLYTKPRTSETATIRYAQELERERNADAFALWQLRPFLSADPEDPFSRESFLAYNEACRQSYIDRIDEQDQRRLRKEAVAAKVAWTVIAK